MHYYGINTLRPLAFILKSFVVSSLFCAGFFSLAAQTLTVPRDIKMAYKNGTRSTDGRPGKKYWQNTGRYNISIRVTAPDQIIKGQEMITYLNNSPDTLKSLNMKMILNIHQAGSARFGGTDSSYITSGVQVDSIAINGRENSWVKQAASSTNHKLDLPAPLLPHDSIKLDISWHYQLANAAGREGVIDPTTFFLAYFYPRVAVYDDYNGWDKLEFNDRQEFYNDFNDYTLSVTVPKNFIVWATGTLQNPEKVLQPEYLERLQRSMLTDSVLHVVTPDDLLKAGITTQTPTNTWVWKADDINDVAVGVSNHYNWDAASVVVDDNTNRRAGMQAAFPDTSADFHQAVKFGMNTLKWFSHNLPGVPYPFPKMTAFQGFADMEFPMMVNDSHLSDLDFARLVQDHEMAHTWFPFYMGINEARFGYMDEGWATTFELFINATEVGREKAEENYKQFRIVPWIKDPSGTEDLPLITPTSELKDGYAHNAYGKASLSYLALKDLLGDTLFKTALHTYMDNWHGKHPVPWDYFNSINTAAGKDLSWFFYNWFYTYHYIDLGIKSVTKIEGGDKITIDNIGGFAVPFNLVLTYKDGSAETVHLTPEVWHKNQKQAVVTLKKSKEITRVIIDGGIFMDADESNNNWISK